VPSNLASRLQAVQAQWRVAGTTVGYASTAVSGIDSGAGYVTYTLLLGDGAPLDAGAYEIVLTGASASEEILLDTFDYTVGAGATPATMNSLTWTAPPAGNAQLVSIDGQLMDASRVNGHLTVDANVAGAGSHQYDVLYTQLAGSNHNLSTDSSAIVQMLGTPPVATTTGYNLKVGANFDAAEAARIAGGVRLEYRTHGAAAFGAATAMSASGSTGYELTLNNLASGQYDVRLTYTDVDGNEVIADWSTVSATTDSIAATTSQTVLARETGGSYQLTGQGLIQVTPGLYTGPIDDNVLAASLTLAASATGLPPGTLAADGSTSGYFVEKPLQRLECQDRQQRPGRPVAHLRRGRQRQHGRDASVRHAGRRQDAGLRRSPGRQFRRL